MDFWRFSPVTDLGFPLEGTYNWLLVAMSVLVASLGAFVALAVVRRVQSLEGSGNLRMWQIVGALTMGTGVWAMHFTAMLAFSLPADMGYVWWITLVSAVPAVIGSAVGLHIMTRSSAEWGYLVAGGLALAVGIGTMHYVGMEAMQGQVVLRYDPYMFVMSIVVALALATLALFVRFALITDAEPRLPIQIVSAGLMGLAVSGMHYTAMGASIFYENPNAGAATALMKPTVMAIIIVGLVSVFFLLALVGVGISSKGAQQGLSRSEGVAPAGA